MVELLPSKQAVASSNLVSRSVGPIAQWQSNRLITGRFLVRVQVGPLGEFNKPGFGLLAMDDVSEKEVLRWEEFAK